MPEFFIADVRKRANAEANTPHQANPEPRQFPLAHRDTPDTAQMKNYESLRKTFSEFAPETPDDPIPLNLPGCDGITMEYAVDTSVAQIDFSSPFPGEEDPIRFLTLYILSGINPADDRRAIRPLEQYADFSQCLKFPLALNVVEDPLAHPSQHQPLTALRESITPLIAAFLDAYFAKKGAVIAK
jgi:hypothetical protein